MEALLLPHPRAGARQLSQLWAATMKKTEKNPHELTLQERPYPYPTPTPNPNPIPNQVTLASIFGLEPHVAACLTVVLAS